MQYPLPTWTQAYSMDEMLPQVDLTTDLDRLVRPGQRTVGLDFLDQGYLNILNGIRTWTVATFRGEKFSTMCFAQQGTTSLWSLNLAFNGLCSPTELTPGMQIRFPLVSEIQRLLSQQSSSSTPVGARVVL